jgi:radical SAM superfamily enzyme YgiQ (UPF0313 family)
MARVALVQEIMVEYMGFMYISAFLKQAGHTVELFVVGPHEENKVLQQVKDFSPDIVGFSILSPSLNFALDFGRRVKQNTRAITVYGNVHAIFNPDIVQEPGVDIVCIGEGENPMLELCSAVDRGEPYDRIEGFWIKTADGIVKNKNREKLVDLNELPFHDRALYDKYPFFRYSNYLRVTLGRGCPYKCTFCSNGPLTDYFGGGKNYIRKQKPERAIREIESLVAERAQVGKKVNFILNIDEVFWVKNDWLREFLRLYKKRIAIPFGASFRFGPIEEEDIKLMAEAKASRLIVAVETGSEEQRRNMMNKPVSNELILQTTGWLNKYKIKFCSSVMFGLPKDTVADHVARLDFYRKLKASYIWTTFFQAYPGLELSESEAVKPYLPDHRDFGMTLHHDMYLDLPDRERLVRLKKIYYLCVIWPWASKLLVWLTKFRIPILFDFLFMGHFAYYAVTFERTSLRQLLVHMKIFGIAPLVKKIKSFFAEIAPPPVRAWRGVFSKVQN